MNWKKNIFLRLILFLSLFLSAKNISPVYGTLGSSVFLHLDKGEQFNNSDIAWMKNNTRIGKLKNSTSYFYKDYGTRAQIFTNGTLRIDKTQESDSGNYTVELFDQDGICIRKEAQHLEIEEAISQPVVEYSCKNKGKLELHCSVQTGSAPVFQWSLDGNTLEGEHAFHSRGTHSLVLSNVLSGRVICTVENNVDKRQSEPVSFTCGGRVGGLFWFMAVGVGVIVLLVVMATVVYHQCGSKPQFPTVIPYAIEDEDEDVIINMIQMKNRVEYSSLKSLQTFQ